MGGIPIGEFRESRGDRSQFPIVSTSNERFGGAIVAIALVCLRYREIINILDKIK